MSTRLMFVLLCIASVFLVSACGGRQPTGDSSTDPESAQSLMPTLPGYSATDATSVTDAITAALGGGSVASGNLPAALLVNRIDALIDCYEDVGAVDAKVYATTSTGIIPTVGALAIINTTRVQDNLLACIANPEAQGVAPPNAVQPCVGSGQLTYNGDNITYIYAASDQSLCGDFEAHFNRLR